MCTYICIYLFTCKTLGKEKHLLKNISSDPLFKIHTSGFMQDGRRVEDLVSSGHWNLAR